MRSFYSPSIWRGADVKLAKRLAISIGSILAIVLAGGANWKIG